ncbi:PIN domain-containing protein [Agrococcus sp. HG114]|nr:PIN domain-containing protein [Agrococcus sp. HG114]
MRAALLDTDVFSALFVSPRETVVKRQQPVETWEALLVGHRVLVSFQTRAELLSGALAAGWGAQRVARLRERLDATPTVHDDRDVVDAYARLSAGAQVSGHALGAPSQVGDRWVAACAIAKGLPLLTGNLRHFAGAPGLQLIDAASSAG